MSQLKKILINCQNEVSQVDAAANANANPQENATASKVEILAKLYLEGGPAQIPDATLVELCDWLWSEFQSTPLNLEFSWYERYNNAAEMFADISANHL